MPQLSENIKKTIVELYNNGHKAKFIAKHVGENIPLSTVYDLISNYKKTGDVKHKKRKRTGKVSADVKLFLNNYMDSNRLVIMCYRSIA